jgi:hypothetical protein
MSTLIFVLAAAASPLVADDVSFDRVSVDVSQSGDKVTATNHANHKDFPGTIKVKKATVPLEVHCDIGIKCGQITATFGTDVPIQHPDPQNAWGSLTLVAVGTNILELKLGDQSLLSRPLKLDKEDDTPPASGGAVPLTAEQTALLLQNPCTTLAPGSPAPRAGYDDKTNEAAMVVGVNGRLMAAPNENLDENDTLTVWVLADSKLKPVLNVKRTSAIRTVGTFNLVGGGLNVNSGRQQGGAETPAFGACEFMPFVVRDFAPGKGSVEIDLTLGATPTAVGSLEFVVDALYRGMLSYGAISTKVVDGGFGLAPAPTGSGKVIVSNKAGDRDVRYAVLLTPFVWGQRDIEKPVPVLHRFNPTFGITTDNTSDNAIVGVTFDWNGFLLSAGIHYGRITELTGGYAAGAAFTGAASEIPTAKRWTHGTFVGVTVDLRAAVQLLRAIAAPAAGGGS